MDYENYSKIYTGYIIRDGDLEAAKKERLNFSIERAYEKDIFSELSRRFIVNVNALKSNSFLHEDTRYFLLDMIEINMAFAGYLRGDRDDIKRMRLKRREKEGSYSKNIVLLSKDNADYRGLVRDGTVGKGLEYRTVNDNGILYFTSSRLEEVLDEFNSSRDMEGIAEIEEVVYKLATIFRVNELDIEYNRNLVKKKVGGYEKGIILKNVESMRIIREDF